MTVAADTVALSVRLRRAFVAGRSYIDNDEKVASSKGHTRFKTRVVKPYPM